ncbi:hypothetical protein B1R32_102136 [Abditibacterium utsteinense]|uniref:Uncharacterized protein n=1 Tax=Abditibacterium utsteinense TaxID=1960156 RepID=A0A2S8SWJ4_9BACT|nr:hypothetical protein [Abditibacterium utsteinense]PQV65129.1 hypothetical protein B1R32_102136 [Abditibacterium utsteinense]
MSLLESPPEPTPTPAKTRKAGLFNASQLAELDESDAVVLAARKPEWAMLLAARDITAAMVDALAQKSLDCRALLTNSKAQKGDSKTHTQLAGEARGEVIGLLQEIQSSARQKFGASADVINSTYYGSTDLRANRATLTQVYNGLKLTLQTETLPGITPTLIAQLTQEFDEYEAALDGKSSVQGGSANDYQAAVAMLAEVTKERQTIQFAANGAFPARDKANRETRKAFKIPPDQNFVG